MANVTLNSVVKEYGGIVAVNNLDLEIVDGEFLTLVGPSGCGKSTTLEAIAGLTLPSDGKVYIGDKDVTDKPPKDRGIAMVFQNIALFPHMDVYDNVSYGLRLRDVDKNEIDRRVEQALTTVQMGGMEDRMPDELSGGQRQRVAISRAIVRKPDVFLMDEPLANLDAKLRVHMRTEIQRLHKELETTTIYVTHDQEEAMTMSDRVAIMNDGQIQQCAPPLECYTEPANLFVAGFIGSPSMNLVDATVEGERLEADNFDIHLTGSTADLDDGQRVVLGVRPEDIYLAENAESASSPSRKISFTTDVLEPMGDEIVVYLRRDDQDGTMALDSKEPDTETTRGELLMKVGPDTDIEEDQRVSAVMDRHKVHLFDAQSGEVVQHGIVNSDVEAAPEE